MDKTHEAILSFRVLLLLLCVNSVANAESNIAMELNGYWLLRPISLAVSSYGLKLRAIRKEERRDGEWIEQKFILMAAIRPPRAPAWLGFLKIFTEINSKCFELNIINNNLPFISHTTALFFIIYCPFFLLSIRSRLLAMPTYRL